jgi:hypothetical protein
MKFDQSRLMHLAVSSKGCAKQLPMQKSAHEQTLSNIYLVLLSKLRDLSEINCSLHFYSCADSKRMGTWRWTECGGLPYQPQYW